MAASATDLLKKYRSLFSTTLSTGIGTGTGDTFTPSTVTGLPTDTGITLTIDRVDSGGTGTPAKLERITGVISGGNFTSYVRAKDNTTEQAHTAGAVIEMVWNAQDWNDIVDWGLTEHNQDGTHSDITASTISASTVSASSVTGTNLNASTVSASSINISGVAVPTISSTSTLTNKRITQRVATTTDDATAEINCDTTDQYELSAIANATEFTVTGTPTDGQKLIIRFKDAGAAKGLTFTGFTALGATIPTTTVESKWGYVGAVYNSAASTWHVLAVGQEA